MHEPHTQRHRLSSQKTHSFTNSCEYTHWYLGTCKLGQVQYQIKCSFRIMTHTITLTSNPSVQPPWPITRATGQATRTWSPARFPPANTANYVCWNAHWAGGPATPGLNPSLCGSWTPICPLVTPAPQKSLFIRTVRLLKVLGEAMGEEEEERKKQKGKDEGNARAESGEMLSGIRDSVWAADLSALWTPGGLTWNDSSLSLAGGKTSKRG